MNKPLHLHSAEAPQKHERGHCGYESFRRKLLPRGGDFTVTQYEIPPGKAAYPYHYHLKNEECFYILSGKGLLRTPQGESEINAGDFLFFPANESGAHKLTNCSETETLVYLDFDRANDLDVCIYPDSDKIGIWGKDCNKLYSTKQALDYYEGEAKPMKTIVCFGDSITAQDFSPDGSPRLTVLLQRAFPDCCVRNAGISGDNTRDALARLAADVLAHAPDAVTVFLGTNDTAEHNRLTLTEYEANLREIIAQIGAAKIVLITPAPIDESLPHNRLNADLTQFAAACVRVAAQTGCRCIDLYARMAARADYPALLSDGLHFNAAGYEFLAPLVAAELLAVLAD